MDSRFLTPGQYGQVADLTGAHTKAGQVRVLVRNGIRHFLNAAGWPVVTWAAVEGRQEKKDDGPEWRSAVLDDPVPWRSNALSKPQGRPDGATRNRRRD